MYYYLLITTNYYKSYKLNATIICTKITNNDVIKQFFKTFHNDDPKKGSLIMILKLSLMMILKKFKKGSLIMVPKQFKKFLNDAIKNILLPEGLQLY